MVKKSTPIYQIKVTLDGTHPPVWRRILVPDDTTLLKLHDILQIVMGWENYHLHMFTIEGSIFGDPADDEYGDLGTLDEARYSLNQVIYRPGQRFKYEYDFGDSWEHTLLVEKILEAEEGVDFPVCIKGKRACPPEDVGGVWGFEGFLEAIQDPSHPEHEMLSEWVGGEFDPEVFILEEVNAQLSKMRRGRGTGTFDPWQADEGVPGPELLMAASTWVQTLPEDQRALAKNLSLRRDMITLLTYLRDHRVKGTQSTGNFPLKDVHEICTQFVSPPILDERIGEHVYRIRSEAEVSPLYFLHVLASVGGLLAGGLGRLWKLTELGEQFLAADAPVQVWHLWVTWWMHTNWLIAEPFGIYEDYLPAGFTGLTLSNLLELPVGVPVPFEQFADQLVESAGLFWPLSDLDNRQIILRAFVDRTVIGPLANFGVLATEHAPHKILGGEFRELSAFQVTHFGKGQLEALAASAK